MSVSEEQIFESFQRFKLPVFVQIEREKSHRWEESAGFNSPYSKFVSACFDGQAFWRAWGLRNQTDPTELPSSPGPEGRKKTKETRKKEVDAFINGDYAQLSAAVSASGRQTQTFTPPESQSEAFLRSAP